MASTVIKRITDTAEALYAIRRAIEAREEEHKKELEGMKAERDAIQLALLADLKKEGLASIKVASGDTFAKSTRYGVDVDQNWAPFALKWAVENGAVSVNKVLAAQRLKDAKELPRGFVRTATDFISVRKAKTNNDVSE